MYSETEILATKHNNPTPVNQNSISQQITSPAYISFPHLKYTQIS